MRTPALRLVLVLLLLAAAGAGALLVREDARAAASAPDSRLDERVDHLVLLVDELRTTQTGYVAPYRDAAAALRRFPALMHELTSLAAQTAALVTTEEASASVRRFVDATSAVAQLDATIREHLLQGDDLTAAHLVYGEAQATARQMTTALVEVRAAERDEPPPDDGRSRTGVVIAGIAALWALGLIVLAVVPPGRTRAADAASVATGSPLGGLSTWPEPRPAAAVTSSSSVDVTAASELCADIAKVETAAAMPALLNRAAGLLGAQRVVIWLGSERQLFAAAASTIGDPEADVPGPVAWDSAGPLAEAWRDGVTTVAADGERAAIASPLFAGQACRGVLGVERPRAVDPATQALAAILAAQFSAVVAGAPADPPVPAATNA